MKYSKKTKKSEAKYLKIKVDRSFAIAESEKSVLFKINYKGKDFKLWINKVGIFPSEYTNTLTISLVDSAKFKYSLYKEDNENWKKPNVRVSGKELFELYEDDLDEEDEEDYEDEEDEEDEEYYEDEEDDPKPSSKKTNKKVRAIK